MPEHKGNRIPLSQGPEMKLFIIELLDSISVTVMKILQA
jgi:hypothetical protein